MVDFYTLFWKGLNVLCTLYIAVRGQLIVENSQKNISFCAVGYFYVAFAFQVGYNLLC